MGSSLALRPRYTGPMTAMTYEEIERTYPNEWVLIVDPLWTGDESMEGGTVMLSILAVSALMTSSNFDACTTGRSAGLAPLRIRPV